MLVTDIAAETKLPMDKPLTLISLTLISYGRGIPYVEA